MGNLWPSYLDLHASGELHARIAGLEQMMPKCRLCAHRCLVNRLEGERGFCRAPAETIYSSVSPHGGEEPCLSGTMGSGTIFFTHCNGRCVFCQNYNISQRAAGRMILEEDLAQTYMSLQTEGCHNLNLVTPAHYLPQIIKALDMAIDMGFRLPIVYNSNGYDAVEALKLLEGIVDIYLPDMKFSDEVTGRALSKMPNYPEVNYDAVEEMYRQVGILEVDEHGIARKGLLIRHLVLPNNKAGTEEVMKKIASIDNDIHVNLMAQYFPCFRAPLVNDINRRISRKEYESALLSAEQYCLRNIMKQNLFLWFNE